MTDTKESAADKVKREKAEAEAIAAKAKAEADEKAKLDAERASKESAASKASKEAAEKIPTAKEDPVVKTDERGISVIDVHSPDQQKRAAEQRGDNLSTANVTTHPLNKQGGYYPDAKDADNVLTAIVKAYDEAEAPDEHICFGYGGYIVRVGDLRAAFGAKKK